MITIRHRPRLIRMLKSTKERGENRDLLCFYFIVCHAAGQSPLTSRLLPPAISTLEHILFILAT